MINANGYTVAGFTGSDRVSAHLPQFVEYDGKENCYLVPVCLAGESVATGYALIRMSHTWSIAYGNVTYHNKVCTVCDEYSKKEKHTVGEITRNADGVLGYICSDCGTFIPYHFVLDHSHTIAQFNTMLSAYGLTSTASNTAEAFYKYMDRNTFSTKTLILEYNGRDDTSLAHILVPVTGYGASTSYVAVYFVPHERMVYTPEGNTNFYDGFFTERHSAYCTGCNKSYQEGHVFDGSYQLVENPTLSVMILTQVCALCGQAVAVTYHMDDTTTYAAFSSLLRPYGFDYYKTNSYVKDEYYVAYGQFYERGGDYNASIDEDGDGIADYYLVEITTAENRTAVWTRPSLQMSKNPLKLMLPWAWMFS